MNKLGILAAVAASLSLTSGLAFAANVSDADKTFLNKDVQGARYELALAKLAQSKASKPQVRSYAGTIVRDHESANVALMGLARESGAKPPVGMTPEAEQTLTKLKGMQGPAFDKAYIDEVTRINAEDQTDSDREKASTHDRRITAYLKKFAAMDARHKTMGEQLKQTVG